jgi:hypothetical protein
MPNWYSTEAWPGIFLREESTCLFFSGGKISETTLPLYTAEFWRSTVIPKFDCWREEMRKQFGREAWLPDDSLINTVLK